MEIYISNKKEILPSIKEVMQEHFKFEEVMVDRLIKYELNHTISVLRDNLWFVIETDYVDKVYRDSYYFYYSSKRNNYLRDCIKVSIFDVEITGNQVEDLKKNKPLSNHYLGYFTLRPTSPNIIGRSVVSPKALKDFSKDIYICSHSFPTTANSIKFEAKGFPHSSQDEETITCAETALWALMEYFGTKYPEYKPLLPSHIISILKNQTLERQVPSQGQAIYSLSYTLKELGFGPKIYSRKGYGDEFDALLSMYVESGVPLILGLDNKKAFKKNKKIDPIGHAVICIGRKGVHNADLKEWTAFQSPYDEVNENINALGVELFDWHDICTSFVFMDDNRPAYQIANIDEPTVAYKDPSWNECKINHFVVPLYKKIYLEAKQARDYFMYLLTSFFGKILTKDIENLAVRMFLTSSRSYKEYIVNIDNMNEDVKLTVAQRDMAKFIWVAELSTKEQIVEDQVNGFILLDATEPNNYNQKPFILACHSDIMLKYDREKGTFGKNAINLQSFSKFNNLEHIE